MSQKGNSILIVLLILLIAGVVGLSGYLINQNLNKPNNPTVQKITSSVVSTTPILSRPITINKDFPPLYPEVKWNATQSSSLRIVEGKNGLPLDPSSKTFYPSEEQIVDIPSFYEESVLLSQVPLEMGSYYANILSNNGWQYTIAGVAGAGFSQGQDSYVKGDQYFIVGSRYILSSLTTDKAVGYKVYVEYTLPGAKRTPK